jgi:tetratricopeptide (TPR) repeat protein
VIRVAVLASMLMLLSACGKVFGPKTWEETLKAVAEAQAKGDHAKVLDLCSQAFEIWDKAGNGGRVYLALECLSDASVKTGKPAVELPRYASYFKSYAGELRNVPGILRLPNNYAIALEGASRRAEAIAALEEALTTYKGMADFGDSYAQRMRVTRNLAKLYTSAGPGEVAASFAAATAAEIEKKVVNGSGSVHLHMGSAAALDALADLLLRNGAAARSAEIAALAREHRVGEEEAARRSPRLARACYPLTIGREAEYCFIELP